MALNVFFEILISAIKHFSYYIVGSDKDEAVNYQ